MAESGSTVPRRQLGRYLRQARDAAGITIEAAATELEWSRAKMYRVEGGQTSVRSHDVGLMCQLYGVPAQMTEVLKGLARETNAKGWWAGHGDAVPDWFDLYLGLEQAASRLRTYAPALVPGLLQTREYAAAVLRTKPDRTESEVEQAVAVRLERQRLLHRRRPAAPRLEVIVDEAVLRRPIEDRQGMAGQLDHLTKVIEARNVHLHVLPLSVGPHRASLAGGFVILDFPPNGGRGEPSTVYSESLTGALYLDKASEVATYDDAWNRLVHLALNERESARLIAAIIGEQQR